MTQHHWQDVRLKRALEHAPDAQAQPSAEVRRHILQAAAKNRAIPKTNAGKGWFHFIVDFFRPRPHYPWNTALGTLLVVGSVSVIWYVTNPQDTLDDVLEPTPATYETSLSGPSPLEPSVVSTDAAPESLEQAKDNTSAITSEVEKKAEIAVPKTNPAAPVSQPPAQSPASGASMKPSQTTEKKAQQKSVTTGEMKSQALPDGAQDAPLQPMPEAATLPRAQSPAASLETTGISETRENAIHQKPSASSTQPAADIIAGTGAPDANVAPAESAKPISREDSSYKEAKIQQRPESKSAEEATLPPSVQADQFGVTKNVEQSPQATQLELTQLVENWEVVYVNANANANTNANSKSNKINKNQGAARNTTLFLKDFTASNLARVTIDPNMPYQTMSFYDAKAQYLGTLTIQENKYWSFSNTTPCKYNCQPSQQPAAAQGLLNSQQRTNLKYIATDNQ